LPVAPAITLLGVFAVHRWLTRAGGTGRGITPRTATIAVLVAWIAVKVCFVEIALPRRTAGRNAQPTGEHLARLVPPGEVLYLCRLKDEGVLFYYGRPARRLNVLEITPGQSAYVLMLDVEWDERRFRGRPEYIVGLRDQQRAPIHLVRLHGPTENDHAWPKPPTPQPSSPSAP
jgi:hypothetical protein